MKPKPNTAAAAGPSIICPNCGTKIELSQAVTHPIEQRLRAEFETEFRVRQQEFDRAIQAKEDELEQRIAKTRAELETEARQQAEQALATELRDMQARLNERDKQLESARSQELELRKKQRDLLEQEKNRELELARRLDEERDKIWQQAATKAAEQHQLIVREKDLAMQQLQRQIDELKKKAEQGPQNRQGEAQELELEDRLRAQFPTDVIEPVAKGRRGGDIVQRVQDRLGRCAGVIVWESKRTRAWSDTWIGKIKDDALAAQADLAVIVTEALPKDVIHAGQVEGVWVVDFPCAMGLAMALREVLLQVARVRTAMNGRTETMQALLNYLTGPQFRQRVESIVESFKTMKEDLDAERRATERIWAKREMQITRVIQNTAAAFGQLQGIIGTSLPAVQLLELPAGSAEERLA